MGPETENKQVNLFIKKADGSYVYMGPVPEIKTINGVPIRTVTNEEEAEKMSDYMIVVSEKEAKELIQRNSLFAANHTFYKVLSWERMMSLGEPCGLKVEAIEDPSISLEHITSPYETWKKVNKSMTDGFCLGFLAGSFTPKKIIRNGPAFIVFWNDGTKTVLKKRDGDLDDPYAAFGQALMIKMFRTNSAAHKIVDRVYVNPFLKYIQDGLRKIDTNPEVNDDNS